VTLAGCSAGESDEGVLCTAIGCSSGAAISLPRLDVPDDERLTVRVGARDVCQEIGLRPAGNPEMLADVSLQIRGQSTPVNVTVPDPRGRLIAKGEGVAPVYVLRPNGPNCPPPPCRRIRVRLQAERLVPVPDR